MPSLCLPSPQNIDFMPTILSRFDMIFIVKDEHNVEKDMVCSALCVVCVRCLNSLSSEPAHAVLDPSPWSVVG